MIKFNEEYESLLRWGDGRLSLGQFCTLWVPKLYDIDPENKRYTTACVDLLGKITRRNDRTIYNWLSGRRKVPEDLERWLFSLNYLWGLYFSLKAPE